jgi:hypothetical protein
MWKKHLTYVVVLLVGLGASLCLFLQPFILHLLAITTFLLN